MHLYWTIKCTAQAIWTTSTGLPTDLQTQSTVCGVFSLIYSYIYIYIMINLSHRDECLGPRSSNLLQWNCRHNWLCTADFTRRRNQQGRLHGELCKHVIHSYLMTEEAAGIGWVAGECCDFSEAELTEASVHACKSWLIIHDLSLTESMHRCLEGNPSHTHACMCDAIRGDAQTNIFT